MGGGAAESLLEATSFDRTDDTLGTFKSLPVCVWVCV